MAQRGLNLERVYEYRFRDVDQETRQAVWTEIALFVHAMMDRPNRVLDPAAGRCEFINSIPAEERWIVDAFDQSTFRSPEVTAIISDIMQAELPVAHFDGVFISNFLEHLSSQDAIASVLTKMRNAMAPGGRIAIIGPNFRYCSREYFDCADHVLALTHMAVAEHLYAADFQVTKVIPRFIPFSFRSSAAAPRLFSLLPKTLGSPVRLQRAAARAYLRSDYLWRIVGKQFLVLGAVAT